MQAVLAGPCSRGKAAGGKDPLKSGLDKSQSFFTGLNLVNNGDKSQTLTTTLPEPARVIMSFFCLFVYSVLCLFFGTVFFGG